MGGRVEHTGDGTLVSQTSRDDTELIELLKTLGFRWSRRLEVWYLPRSWREETRRSRVRQLEQARPDLEVDCSRAGERVSVAEREEGDRERAAARAERMDARAARARTEAEAEDAKRRQISDGIPLGQPILAGHHSQRRHERDLERMDRHFDKSLAAERRAAEATVAGDRARARAQGRISTVSLGNRVEQSEAELRRVRRRLEGSGKAIHCEDRPADGAYLQRLERQQSQLIEQLEYDRTQMAERISYSRETVAVGDLVRVAGLWLPVVRANTKSVTVPSPVLVRRTQTAPWHSVTAHLVRAQATASQVRDLAEQTSTAFPDLRSLLEEIAAQLSGQ